MWKSRLILSLLTLTLGGVGLNARSPFLLAWREALPWIFAGLGLALAWRFRRRRAWALLLLVIGALPFYLQGEARSLREQVLAADPRELQRFGRHFLVGYRDYDALKELVAHGAVGGVFITHHNIRGKTADEVRQEISELQAMQAAQGLPPLYIATDQEGGLVSRLSPLVPAQPSLAVWLRSGGTAEAYAELQAAYLAGLGVNLNFSPVVDLKHPAQEKRFHPRTLIEQRAISEDPETVAAAARKYCLTFERHGLRCTLKHFPGLGQVTVDTHFHEGALDLTQETLEAGDWLPFRKTLGETEAFLMLGHVKVSQLDPELPASLSPRIIDGLIRRDWGHQGVILTDDFTMGPIQGRKGGVGAAVPQALKAGVDIVLISYDPELYYEAMAGLLSTRDDAAMTQALAESERRLRQDLDRRAVAHQTPDLLDLGVGDRDAAVGPIVELMDGGEIRHAVWQSVNHDGAPGLDATGLGGLDVAGSGI